MSRRLPPRQELEVRLIRAIREVSQIRQELTSDFACLGSGELANVIGELTLVKEQLSKVR